MHNPALTVLLLLTTVTFLAFIARRLRIPYPTLMVLTGATLGWVPGLPHVEFDSETVLLVFLPPLLYAAAWQMSWRDFRANLRPITLLAVGLVLATTVVVAALAHAAIEGMPWSLAFALGALVAPPDAVAATAVTRGLALPRRLVTVIEGESLVNDATGLVLYRVAVAAAVTGLFSPTVALTRFVVAPAGGIAIGLAIGWIAARIHSRLNDPTIECIMTLLTPFAAYLPAEAAGVSGVLAIVTAGMYVSKNGSRIFSPATRLNATAVWEVVVFLLNGLAFTLVGLQIPEVLTAVAREPVEDVIGLTGLVCLAVIVVRLVWVFPAAFLPRLISQRLREKDPLPPLRDLAVLGWAGMRGVVTVAAALALPRVTAEGSPLPHREILVLVAFAVVLTTLVLQGQTLPMLIRRLKVSSDADEQFRIDAAARREILAASMEYLDAASSRDGMDGAIVRHLRERYERLLAGVLAAAAAGATDPASSPLERLQLEVLAEQRRKLAELAARGVLPLEVCRRIERVIDLDEARVGELLPGRSLNST